MEEMSEVVANGDIGNAQIVAVLQIEIGEAGPVMVVVGQTRNLVARVSSLCS